MSLRNSFNGSIVKPGFNPLGAQTSVTYYNLLSWGDNGYGQLGLGNTTSYSSPKQVGALTTWLTPSGEWGSFAAIKTDSTLWSWGRNNVGQLGLGNTTNYSSPKQVGALTNWSKVFGTVSGGGRRMAIKTDKTLWAWGSNGSGQLGLGNTTSYSSPKQVGALTGWLNVASGYSFTLAITS